MSTPETLLKKYPYRAKPWVMVLCGVFFAACGYAIFKDAQTNEQGLIINHMIELDASQATIFYWVLLACCVGFVAIAILGLISAVTKDVYLMVTDHSITIPSALCRRTKTIAFADVTGLRLQQVQRQTFLTLSTHANGKGSISRANMPSKAAFEELVAIVESKVSFAQ